MFYRRAFDTAAAAVDNVDVTVRAANAAQTLSACRGPAFARHDEMGSLSEPRAGAGSAVHESQPERCHDAAGFDVITLRLDEKCTTRVE